MKPMVYILGTQGGEPYLNYRTAVRSAGAFPVLPSDGISPEACRGLLLPGGGDIPGQLPTVEQQLIRFFVETKRPILGICRGMQALNVFFGGSLYQDISGHRIPGGDMVHSTVAEGPIDALFGTRPTVNSNHHQAVERLGHGLAICQWTEDGIAEAVCHADLPVLGVQWHPERQSFDNRRNDAVDAAPLFYRFVRLLSVVGAGEN